MANDNNKRIFTAADIEKYHKGLLGPADRHALEKAALDDPFLADALEGYTVAGQSVQEDLASLQQKLAERTGSARVIPLHPENKKSIPWLRIAAMLLLLVGAGLLANQLLFNKKKNDIALADRPAEKTTDTAVSTVTATSPSATQTPAPGSGSTLPGTPSTSTVTPDNNYSAIQQKTPVSGAPAGAAKQQVDAVANVGEPGTAPFTAKENTRKDVKQKDASDQEKDMAKSAPPPAEEKTDYRWEDQDAALKKEARKNEVLNRSVTAKRNTDDPLMRNQGNIFRGRVTDAANIGVPFANVTNTQDNAGTYTDAKGYFNLVSADTLLNVQVRSIGFENQTAQLRNSLPSNQVVLQDDRSSLSEVVVSRAKPNANSRSRESNITLEEPEPEDGWDKYDTYLANNLVQPESIRSRPSNVSSSVQVSFEVDKKGEPVNFKIEKSLCPACDKEAIRLIKEGPKWKRKARKGRTTVTINF